MTGNRESGQFVSVANALFEAKCIKFGDFTLKSGGKSPIYVDLRMIRSFPDEKATIVSAYAEMITRAQQEIGVKYHLLADVPTGVTPIVSSLSDRLRIPQISPRVAEKDHGTKAKIEGDYTPGQEVALIEDLVTSGGSIIEAKQVLTDGNLDVFDVFALVDRQQGGRKNLLEAGCNLHPYCSLPELIAYYYEAGKITEELYQRSMAIWD